MKKRSFNPLCSSIVALSFITSGIASADPATPKEPAQEKAAAEPKAETPVEKQAFKMFDLISTLPEILGGIKDVASADAADKKIDDMIKQMKAEEAALFKLEVPDNNARIKLDKKMQIKMQSMQAKMLPIMMGMQELTPEVAIKLQPIMEKFMTAVGKTSPEVDKYFKPDPKEGEEKSGE